MGTTAEASIFLMRRLTHDSADSVSNSSRGISDVRETLALRGTRCQESDTNMISIREYAQVVVNRVHPRTYTLQ